MPPVTLSHSGTADLWPWLFAFNAIPALICLIFLPCCPESPRFLLIKKGEDEEARQGEFKRWLFVIFAFFDFSRCSHTTYNKSKKLIFFLYMYDSLLFFLIRITRGVHICIYIHRYLMCCTFFSPVSNIKQKKHTIWWKQQYSQRKNTNTSIFILDIMFIELSPLSFVSPDEVPRHQQRVWWDGGDEAGGQQVCRSDQLLHQGAADCPRAQDACLHRLRAADLPAVVRHQRCESVADNSFLSLTNKFPCHGFSP